MQYIAERKLLCLDKKSQAKREITIRISEPFWVDENDVDFSVEGGVSCCRVEIDGLIEKPENFYGTDSIQAISLASNIDPLIARLGSKYEFFWVTGDPYFD